MATEAQSAASRLNGARGQGPTSERGRLISSMNSLKHGFRSERVAEEVESSSALEERRRTWLAQCDAQTDMDEFLITSNVVLSFNLERVRRAAAACLDARKKTRTTRRSIGLGNWGAASISTRPGRFPSTGSRPSFSIRSGLPRAERRMKQISPLSLSTSSSPRW